MRAGKKHLLPFIAIGAVLLTLGAVAYVGTGAGHALKCSDKRPLPLGKTTDPNLKALEKYQKKCGSFVTDKLMVFTNFPGNAEDADEKAAEMAGKLERFHAAGVVPIVIAEPYVGTQALPYKGFLAGAYDTGLDRFFQSLKVRGVTGEMMGTWVPFPESNTPLWNNKATTPKDFALCVNKYLSTMKRYFPKAKGSVLLNAMTYDPSDKNWENGTYADFSAYVGPLDKKLVTSFGMQGFPWMAEAGQAKRPVTRASEFLQPDLVMRAAEMLRTRDIWFNTGTFASKYTSEPAKTVHPSLSERKKTLESILDVAGDVRDDRHGYRVFINLFSEDKSSVAEATDWSYLNENDSTVLLKDFLARAYKETVPVSLYDKAK